MCTWTGATPQIHQTCVWHAFQPYGLDRGPKRISYCTLRWLEILATSCPRSHHCVNHPFLRQGADLCESQSCLPPSVEVEAKSNFPGVVQLYGVGQNTVLCFLDILEYQVRFEPYLFVRVLNSYCISFVPMIAFCTARSLCC